MAVKKAAAKAAKDKNAAIAAEKKVAAQAAVEVSDPNWTKSTEASAEDFQKRLQPLGGIYRDDPTAIPETAILYDGTTVKCKEPGMVYRWASYEKIPKHKRYGYRFVMYKDYFTDTGLFESDNYGRVVNGDTVLMFISKEESAKIRAEYEKLAKEWEDGIDGDFHSEVHSIARQYNLRNFYTTREKDGRVEEIR